MQKLEKKLQALEDERRKVEAFKRELPLCMQLLDNAIDSVQRDLREAEHHDQLATIGKASAFPVNLDVPTVSAANNDVASPACPLGGLGKHDKTSGHDEHSHLQDGTKGWLRHESTSEDCEQFGTVTALQEQFKKGENSRGIKAKPISYSPNLAKMGTDVAIHQFYGPKRFLPSERPGGAFSPFSKSVTRSAFAAAVPSFQRGRGEGGEETLYPPCSPVTELALGRSSDAIASNLEVERGAHLRLPMVSVEEEKRQGGELESGHSSGKRSRGSDMSLEGGNSQLLVGSVSSPLSSATASSQQRKSRRNWSPELHRRFLVALNQLGGPQVATPKQIRELMKVEGLTNDEVKSHLQKFRLHSQRSRSPVSMGYSATASGQSLPPPVIHPQLLMLGGLWVPPPPDSHQTVTGCESGATNSSETVPKDYLSPSTRHGLQATGVEHLPTSVPNVTELSLSVGTESPPRRVVGVRSNPMQSMEQIYMRPDLSAASVWRPWWYNRDGSVQHLSTEDPQISGKDDRMRDSDKAKQDSRAAKRKL